MPTDVPRTPRSSKDKTARAEQRREAARAHLKRVMWAAITLLVLGLIVASALPRKPLEPALAPPPTWFNDNAQLTSRTFAANMNLRLPIERHAQIVVVIEAHAPDDLEDFTSRSAQDWHVGTRGADNGIVLFIFPSARTVRLEIGYGLEGALTDVDAKRLLEAELIPAFAQGRYEDGIYDFLSALFKWFEDDTHQAKLHALDIGFVDSLVATLRQVPRYARIAWALFATGDLGTRAGLVVMGAVITVILGEL
ncbi:MAG TPA: TPM domain-containing protein, partial [Casimicrobiaceae bacterium]|nr:TPM domain-containing protein [Casimicrobiaceae bacterium]